VTSDDVLVLSMIALAMTLAAFMATNARQREQLRQTQALLDGARRRERSALNLLADMQALKRPFPHDDTAGSLSDEVEAWLATNPPTEQ
jgi:hypothetical protein